MVISDHNMSALRTCSNTSVVRTVSKDESEKANLAFRSI
jgi:hypothetical protein